MSLFNNKSEKENKGAGLKKILELAKPSLNLTQDQEQRINEIIKGFRDERKDLKSQGGDNMRGDIKDARHETIQKIKDVLNDNQKQIFEQNIHNWREQAK